LEPVEEESKLSDQKLSVRQKRPLFTFKSGNTYLGEWVGDKPDGFGVKTFASGSRYEGDFKNGLMHGSGKKYFKPGDMYEGDWKDDEMAGRGVYRWAN